MVNAVKYVINIFLSWVLCSSMLKVVQKATGFDFEKIIIMLRHWKKVSALALDRRKKKFSNFS